MFGLIKNFFCKTGSHVLGFFAGMTTVTDLCAIKRAFRLIFWNDYTIHSAAIKEGFRRHTLAEYI